MDFTDAQAQHEATPDTFEVPSDKELSAIAPGDYVKVCFDNERFWVEVDTTVDGSQFIMGKVSNDLIHAPFELGATVAFKRKHVYAVAPADIATIPYDETEGEDNIQHFHDSCNKA